MVYIWLVVVLAVLTSMVTGWWRLGFHLFAIRPRRMTVDRLGLEVSSASDVQRVDTLLRSFAGGFNAMITKRSISECRAYSDSLPVLFQPFAEEGMAMGYTLRHLFRYDPEAFESEVVKERPQYRYLYYVGLGFWSGMRHHDPQQLERVTVGLDPLHRYLCYDGFGFKHAFFDYPKGPEALRPLERLEGYARNAAYQGVGRGLWFLYKDRPDLLIEHVGGLGEHAVDAAAGVGLAAVFVYPDRLEVAQELGAKLPSAWHEHFHLGMCFALKARSLNDLDQFERDLARLDPRVQGAAYASVRECDRIELQVRSDRGTDGYGRWRGLVTAWMAEHIDYPLVGLKASESKTPTQVDAGVSTAEEVRG
jgi:hypothetical protein